ncbi:oligosaccharide flippase family protein [Vibrio alginolyticus]
MNRLLRSIFSLTALKALDFLFPIVLIPFAINIFGIEKYGVISFFQTLSLVMLVIVDFGFNVSGIQRISVCKSKHIESKYITASILIKVLLFIFSSFLYYLFAFISPLKDNTELIHAFYLVLFSGVLNFQWYYQAKEKYYFILLVSLFSRIFGLMLFFVFVSEKDDYILFALILVSMYLIPSTFHFFDQVIKKRFSLVKASYLKVVFTSNWNIFVYRFVNSGVLPAYVYAFSFILTPAQLGALGFVQRIMGAAINFSMPITQALIPHLARLKHSDEINYKVQFKKYSFYFFLLSTLVMISIPGLIYFLLTMNIVSGGFYFVDAIYPMILVLSVIPHIMNSLFSQNLVLISRGSSVQKSVLIAVTVSIPLFVVTFFSCGIYLPVVYVLTYWFMMILMLFQGDRE